jgi:dolichol-phosphate mannosyltransferase
VNRAGQESGPVVSVIVPTFREAANLPELVRRVHEGLQRAGLTGEIIIVDDDSHDGTEESVHELATRFPVRLILRKNERGLSSAVLCGLNVAGGQVLVVMDADLSHPPETIPALVRIIREGEGDFAVGSRYTAGGRVEGWNGLRWLNSKVATILARPVTSCSDPMSGFFALAAERYRQAVGVRPRGYKIGLELMVKCGCQRVRDVPIRFVNRVRGESKLTIAQRLLYLRQLAHLLRFKYFGTARRDQLRTDRGKC